MRVSGLASGMDIDSIVKDMMKSQRVPLDKLKQQKQTLEWQRDDYRAINSQLLTFRNSLLDMKLTSAYRVRTVSSSDESKVTATASSAASLSSFNIDKVKQLAKAEVRLNEGKIYNGKLDVSKPLFEQNAELTPVQQSVWKTGAVVTAGIKGDGSSQYKMEDKDVANISSTQLSDWSVKVDGKAFKVVTGNIAPTDSTVVVDSDGTLKFKNAINTGSNIQVNYIGNQVTEKMTIGESLSKWKLSQNGIENAKEIIIKGKKGDQDVPDQKYTIDGNGIIYNGSEKVGSLNKSSGEITFDPGKGQTSTKETTYTMGISYQHKYTTFAMDTSTSKGEQYENFIVTGKDSLNNLMSKVNNSKIGVNMFYDTATGQISLTRSETGTFKSDTQKTEIRGVGAFFTDVLNFDMTRPAKEKAANAKFEINGLSTERPSNTFEMNGVTFTLKQEFTTPVNIGISNDSKKVYENISNFIKSYNELIDKIQGKLDEKRNRNYSPLTDEQKESLSDKQQEKWEEIAKAGLLRHDSTLSNVLSNMRTDFYATVQNSEISSDYNQLAKIGITTSKDYLSGGKLEINETKLKKAIEENPDSVEQLFRGENGIMSRLTTSLTKGMDAVKLKAGNDSSTNRTFTIGRELDSIDKRVDTFEDRMKDLEDRYYRQFTAMEQAIQKANSQSNYLYSFFSNGN